MKKLILASALCLLAALPMSARRPARGTTVMGTVYLDGKPLSGVTVSDGILFARTDSCGIYELRSQKAQGLVFVITPSGTQPDNTRGIFPAFWAALRKPAYLCETHDFRLHSVDDSDFRILMLGCMQLGFRNGDLQQLARSVVPALRRATEEANKQRRRTCAVMLGDVGNSSYWYSSEFDLGDVRNELRRAKFPVAAYSVIGEGDHDGAVPFGAMTDQKSEKLYSLIMGPRYYSFNIGAAHVVVLDDIIFRNERGGKNNYPKGIVGRRNFDAGVTFEQTEWLRKDLATVDRSTKIILCAHHPLFRTQGKGTMTSSFARESNMQELLDMLRPFADVHIFTSHSARRRYSRPADYPNIIEHDVLPVSGTQWSTLSYSRLNICGDGADAGFEVVDGTADSLTWHCRSLCTPSLPMRAYDMNCVARTYRSSEKVQRYLKLAPTRYNYADKEFHNCIYVNYWGYEEGCKVEILENGKPLKIKKVSHEDPLQTLVWEVSRCDEERFKPSTRNYNNHMFRAQSADSLSHITVRTRDRFGRIDTLAVDRTTDFAKQCSLTNRLK